VVFQPSGGEFAAEERLLNEPIYKKARDKIVEFIKQLQAARKPEDYVALHRSVLTHFIAYQEAADDAMSPSRRSSSTPASAALARACSSIAGDESIPTTRRPVSRATGIATRPFPTASSTRGPSAARASST
jgi:hypothetical protein